LFVTGSLELPFLDGHIDGKGMKDILVTALAEVIWDDSDCKDQSAKMSRQPAERFSRRNADQAWRKFGIRDCENQAEHG
jgi:hypothetical protein